ncbi:hypothetical protein HDV00_001537 [Rhizophlyctis rosea]|nr:hypothetical protein HDV00_001537 [Rhizophlyctis rosea]
MNKTEKILTARLTQHGKQVERGMELMRYDIDDKGGVAYVKGLSGKDGERKETETEEEIRFKYIVGTDGVHSVLRKGWKSGDWKFEALGKSLKNTWALADATISSPQVPFNPAQFYVFNHHEGVTAIVPLTDRSPRTNNSHFRIIMNLGPYEVSSDNRITHGVGGGKVDYSISIEDMKKIMDERTFPIKIDIGECVWVTKFYINERQANGYERGGRAFLCGDAGHCHSPVGGQGMNLGITDAHNLAWKLALTIKASSTSPSLLSSYTYESHPNSQSTSIASSGTWLARMARKWFVPFFASVPFMRKKAGWRASQCGVKYEGEGVWIMSKDGRWDRVLGERMCDAVLAHPYKTCNRNPTTVHALFRPPPNNINLTPRYTIILPAPHPYTPLIPLQTLIKSHPNLIKSVIIRPFLASSMNPSHHALTLETKIEEYLDKDGTVFTHFQGEVVPSPVWEDQVGEVKGVVVVVRPDGVVGGVVEEGNKGWKKIEEFVGRV